MQNHHLGRCSAFLWSLEPRLTTGPDLLSRTINWALQSSWSCLRRNFRCENMYVFISPSVWRKKIQLQFPAPRPTRAQKCLQASRAQAELYRSESHVTVSGYGEGWWSAERVVRDQMFYCPSHLARRLLARPQGTQGVCEDPPVFGYVLEHSSSGPIVTHNTDLPFVFMDLPEHASLEDWGVTNGNVASSWFIMNPQIAFVSTILMKEYHVPLKICWFLLGVLVAH